MADTLTSKCHRKRWAPRCHDPPFPITIGGDSWQSSSWRKWPVYTAYLYDGGVYVKHSGDMEWLYKMGFFGKGSLSRSRPQYNKITNSRTSGKPLPKVVSRRRFLRHQTWQQLQQKSEHGVGNVQDFDAEAGLRIKSERKWYIPEQLASKRRNLDEQQGTDDVGGSENVGVVREDVGFGHSDIWTGSAGYVSEVSQKEVISSDIVGDSEMKDVWADQEADVEFWCSDPLPGASLVEHEGARACSESDTKVKLTPVDFSAPEGETEISEMEIIQEEPMSGTFVSVEEMHQSGTVAPSPGGRTKSDAPIIEPFESPGINKYDERSLVDEPNGDLLVVDDSDGEGEDQLSWKPCMKGEPFPVKEYIQLTLEEKPLTIPETWRKFCDLQPSFLPRYIVYHYYRSKGWVPKTGLKYGADLLLYKQGPPFYHSSFSVLVRLVNEYTLTDIPEFPQRPLTWASLAGVDRVIEHVSKSVLYCYVIKPQTIHIEHLTSPKCIPTFSVKEILLKRWVSSQEREERVQS